MGLYLLKLQSESVPHQGYLRLALEMDYLNLNEMMIESESNILNLIVTAHLGRGVGQHGLYETQQSVYGMECYL
jgi:hypothetical protein